MLNHAAEVICLTLSVTPICFRFWASDRTSLPSCGSLSGYGTVAVKPFGNAEAASSDFAFARLKLYFGSVA